MINDYVFYTRLSFLWLFHIFSYKYIFLKKAPEA